jgi:hypothetical protein
MPKSSPSETAKAKVDAGDATRKTYISYVNLVVDMTFRSTRRYFSHFTENTFNLPT